MEQTLSKVSESTSNTVRPVLRIALTARRKPLYFFWNIMLPMALIEALAYGSFAVPREDVADRLSVSLTMVLTAVAFKQIISAELPNVSYLTLLDVFVLASFASTCLVAFENIVVGQVASSPEGAPSSPTWTRSSALCSPPSLPHGCCCTCRIAGGTQGEAANWRATFTTSKSPARRENQGIRSCQKAMMPDELNNAPVMS